MCKCTWSNDKLGKIIILMKSKDENVQFGQFSEKRNIPQYLQSKVYDQCVLNVLICSAQIPTSQIVTKLEVILGKKESRYKKR